MAKRTSPEGTSGPEAGPVTGVEAAIADAVEIAAAAGLRIRSANLRVRLRQALAIGPGKSADGSKQT